jgi:hypothetical protein
MKSTHVIRRLAVAFRLIVPLSGIPERGALGQQPTDKVVLLGWSPKERLQYYFTSQGSAVMPYDLFLNLGRP